MTMESLYLSSWFYRLMNKQIVILLVVSLDETTMRLSKFVVQLFRNIIRNTPWLKASHLQFTFQVVF